MRCGTSSFYSPKRRLSFCQRPEAVARALVAQRELIAFHGLVTFVEIVLGLAAGIALGGACALDHGLFSVCT